MSEKSMGSESGNLCAGRQQLSRPARVWNKADFRESVAGAGDCEEEMSGATSLHSGVLAVNVPWNPA